MLRCLVTVAVVALLSGAVSHFEQAQGQRDFVSSRSDATTWVRTVDGWEPSIVLLQSSEPKALPALHPVLVASFQFTASVFALLAFPAATSRGEYRGADAAAGRMGHLRIPVGQRL